MLPPLRLRFAAQVLQNTDDTEEESLNFQMAAHKTFLAAVNNEMQLRWTHLKILKRDVKEGNIVSYHCFTAILV